MVRSGKTIETKFRKSTEVRKQLIGKLRKIFLNVYLSIIDYPMAKIINFSVNVPFLEY